MQPPEEGTISIETLRFLTERAGLQLSDEQLAEVAHIYDPAQVEELRKLDLESVEPATVFIPPDGSEE